MRKLTNSTGHLLQLSVENTIRRNPSSADWQIVTHEFPWQDSLSLESGFADLILRSSCYLAIRAVIECKRVRDGDWVFLQSDRAEEHISQSCCCWAERANADPSTRWKDTRIHPVSWRSEFCIIRGSGDKGEPYLERVSRRLLAATEAIAMTEIGFENPDSTEALLIYLPIIVTNANLSIAQFSLNDIDPETGALPRSKGKFESVPFVRFHKNLCTDMNDVGAAGTLSQVAKRLERTVFVVNAARLLEFFGHFDIRE
ncbi:hypothetical protein ACFL6M_04765 [Candidatus Eisenbacteria bacterium]|uniref:Uncharacterized protein n=1 Tax=Eiseniibacteriota bacterium TaxID=2212470 RepID=A0ABV6YKQ3_UNCEI